MGKLLPGSLQARYVSQDTYYLGEGPFWDSFTQSLFHVDTFNGDIVELNITTGQSTRLNIGNYIGVVIPVHNQPGKLVVSKRNIVIEVNWPRRTFRRLSTNDVGLGRFNDGKVDARGRLWLNTLVSQDYYSNDPSIKNAGALYKLNGFELIKMDTDYTIPNGMAWNGASTLFYVADTTHRKIYIYNYDLHHGTISNRRIFFDFNTYHGINSWEVPDGMAMDDQDNLWVAVLNGGRVMQIDIKTAKVIRFINTRVNQTTSIAFGGSNYDKMFVTNGNRDLITYQAKSKQPNIGRVLEFTAPYICGRPAYKVILPPNHLDLYPDKQVSSSDLDINIKQVYNYM